MATPVGTNLVSSISRRYIMPDVVDFVYRSNVVTFRLLAQNKKIVQGGTQIEVPAMYQAFTNGGPYQGYQLLDVAPNDTVKNLAFDWKQQYVPVSIDRLSLIKLNSPEAVANGIGLLFAQAQMQMVDNLGTGVWSDAVTDPIQIDGLKGAVDAGTITTTYGGLTRASNTWLNSTVDATTTTLTLVALQSLFMNATEGGRAPTLIASRAMQYNRLHNLLGAAGTQTHPVMAGGHDEQLASAGFTNVLYNNTPWVVDSHVPDGATNASNSDIYMLNEDYIQLVTNPMADFYLEDFQVPINQDAMVAKILWAGNLVVMNTQRQAKMTTVTG
jgi:hypothetical protein